MGLWRQILPIITYANIDVRKLLRDKVAIFFTIIFPLIFLFVFGGLFGNNSNVNFNIALINESQTSFSTEFAKEIYANEIFKVKSELKTESQAKDALDEGTIDGVIILPANFGELREGVPSGNVRLLFSQSSASAGQTLSSILDTTAKEINRTLVPTVSPINITAEGATTKGLTQFDYTFSGLLGFALLSLGVFGPTSTYPRLKQRGVLARYRTTPLKVWQYFMANVLSNMIYGLISVFTMFAAAVVFFDLQVNGNIFAIALLVMLGAVVLFGIGLAVGGWAKNESQAAPLANLIAFPMMFLSGSFFPRFLMPEWLQRMSDFLPLTPVIDGTRMVVTEGMSLAQIMPQICLLAAWGVIVYFVAFRVFRWE